MKQKQQILILVIIIVLAALVWTFYIKKGESTSPESLAPVADEDNGRFVPELNNTIETSVTVIAPTTPPTGVQ